MIERIIDWSANNRFLVFLGTFFAVGWGVYAVANIPLDAIPDLSDVQVIVFTEWPGRSPDLVEDQITYPIVTSLISAPRVKRGARLLVLRPVVRLRHLRRRHRHVLGPLAGPRVHERGLGRSARGRQPDAGPGRHRRRLGVRIRAHRPHRRATTWPSCAASRIGTCATGSRASRVSPKWPASAVSCSQYQVTVDPNTLLAYNLPDLARHRWRSAPATTTSAAASPSSPAPSTWCAAAVTSRISTTCAT